MNPLIYHELVDWYRLLDPVADHLDEAETFQAAFQRVVSPAPVTLLEHGLLLRDGLAVRAVHDRHTLGVFSRATWHRLLARVGFEVEEIGRPLGEGRFDDIFLGRVSP
jgi:hypothetical protein